ncbi:MAG: OmpA family protein [Deltaproteobacteria bacterium]|jgi:flagellar motor protein MotB|nr:OmpA family protein [Deltaproteobacteria bacterium]
MPSHPPVPNLVKPNPPPTPVPAHPLLERQVESSLPLLGDSQFELVLDPNLVAMVDDPIDLDPPAPHRPDTDDGLVALADEPELDALRGYHRRRTGLWVFANLLGVGALAYAGYSFVGDLRGRVAQLEDEKVQVTQRLEETERERAKVHAEKRDAEQRRDELTATLTTKEAELATQKAALEAEAQKIGWIPDAQAALELSLAAELKRGDASLRIEGPVVIVELSDRLMFSGVEAQLTAPGEVLLGKLGPVLTGISGKQVQVRGHVDAAPTGAMVAKYPNGYAWATARATRVLEVLQAVGQVPASRLALAAYGEHHPKVPGKGAAARKKNRRVEVAIGP